MEELSSASPLPVSEGEEDGEEQASEEDRPEDFFSILNLLRQPEAACQKGEATSPAEKLHVDWTHPEGEGEA